MAARFRYGDRWLALRSIPASDTERAALEGRDRQLEDYVSALAETGGGGGGGVAMVSYTPTLGGVTAGDGVLVAAYGDDGDLSYIRVRFTLGATSAIVGPITVTAPGGAQIQADSMLHVWFRDNDADTGYAGTAYVTATTDSAILLEDGDGLLLESGDDLLTEFVASAAAAIELRPHNTSGTYATYDHASATVPHTWASGDWFAVSGWIEPV